MFGCITRTLNCRYKRMNTNANINFTGYRLTHLETTFVSWGVNIHAFKNKQTISLFAIKSSQLACCIFKYALLQHLPIGWTYSWPPIVYQGKSIEQSCKFHTYGSLCYFSISVVPQFRFHHQMLNVTKDFKIIYTDTPLRTSYLTLSSQEIL